jgi:hypothetical protein
MASESARRDKVEKAPTGAGFRSAESLRLFLQIRVPSFTATAFLPLFLLTAAFAVRVSRPPLVVSQFEFVAASLPRQMAA